MKVRCKLCVNTDGVICEIKGFKVGQNKSRICNIFELDNSKVKQPSKMKATYIPYHLRDKKAYKQHQATTLANQQAVNKQDATINGMTQSSPDCLSKYRATVLPE